MYKCGNIHLIDVLTLVFSYERDHTNKKHMLSVWSRMLQITQVKRFIAKKFM